MDDPFAEGKTQQSRAIASRKRAIRGTSRKIALSTELRSIAVGVARCDRLLSNAQLATYWFFREILCPSKNS